METNTYIYRLFAYIFFPREREREGGGGRGEREVEREFISRVIIASANGLCFINDLW